MTIAAALLRRFWSQVILAAALAIALLTARHWHALATAEANARQTQTAQYTQAQADARAAWMHEKARLEFQSRVDAHESDIRYAQLQAAGRRALADHTPSQRLRPAPAASAAGGTASTGEDHDPSLRAGLPADRELAVSITDLQACTDATAYALSLREWALGLGQPSSNP